MVHGADQMSATAAVFLHHFIRSMCLRGVFQKTNAIILLLRLPRVRARILQLGEMCRCPHGPQAHQALIGRQPDGSFHTSRAKVYPKGLNVILGEELYRFATQLGASHVQNSMPEAFATLAGEQLFCESLIQPDYHG